MATTSLPTISSPFELLGKFGVHSSAVAPFLLGIVLLFWVIYTLVAIYHWVRYSHAALIAIPAIIVYLIVSGIIVLFIFATFASA